MNFFQFAERQQQILKKQHTYQASAQQYAEATYRHREFPKWKYHPSKPAVLVKNADEEKNLGPDWTDKRIIFDIPPCENDLRSENEDLKKQLAALKKS